MPSHVYFDTVAFRHIGKVYSEVVLADELRDRIVISPLTAFEVFSQLSIEKADDVLKQVHAVLNYINPQHTGLLPWPDATLKAIWNGKFEPDDDFTKRMQKAFNTCLATERVETLREEAGKMKDAMDEMKEKSAGHFDQLLDAMRKKELKPEDFSTLWFNGITNRIKADPKSKKMDEVIAALNAYHEFDKRKLQVALANKDYSPLKHKNDVIDAEQMVYLQDSDLHFLTCDKGFGEFVRESPQRLRIHTVLHEDLADSQKIDTLIRTITD